MKAVIINSHGDIIAAIAEEFAGAVIRVAGAKTITGDPVNMRTYRVSRDQRKLAKAERMDIPTATAHRGGEFYML